MKLFTWRLLLGLSLLTLAGCELFVSPTLPVFTPTLAVETAVPTETSTSTLQYPTETVLPVTSTPPLPTVTFTSSPVLPSSTPSPRPTQTPTLLFYTATPWVSTLTPTSSPSQAPVILYFEASVTEADPGETITLAWRSEGGTKATLYHLLQSGQYSRFWEVAPTGSMHYTIPDEARNWEGFVLYVYNDADQQARADLTIYLRCPDAWFFSPPPDICPSGPALFTDGAEQHFEHGLALWNRSEDRIYVLIDHGLSQSWRAFEDTWEESMPESDPALSPPGGLYQPIRGIGRVWREEFGIREQLGWALGPEVGYGTAIQRTSRFKYNDTYIKALDGGVWKLGPEGGSWHYLP